MLKPVRAAAGDCTLIVPANPLTATGLATPYQLEPPCSEADANTQAFVQGAVFDPATKSISIYNPLVTDQGVAPAIAPTAPVFPANAVVALWFGFNGNNLMLTGDGAASCVQGFVQFAYCNAPAFFQAVNQAGITIPALGMGKDNLPCPTVRDFSIVDQDQSDNTPVTYLVTAGGQFAQDTAANRATLGMTLAKNPSDERLLVAVDKALGCTPFMAPDLANNNALAPALPLNELQAAAFQADPVALVPAGDPFVLVNGDPNLAQTNGYRAGVDQMPVNTLHPASTGVYCRHIVEVALTRLNTDKPFTVAAASPVPDVANSLFTFLAQRLQFTLSANGLNCVGRLGIINPVTTTVANNIVTDAVIAAQVVKGHQDSTQEIIRHRHQDQMHRRRDG